jgi:hypothetical protein
MNTRANSYVGSRHSGMPEIVMAAQQARITMRLQGLAITKRRSNKYE